MSIILFGFEVYGDDLISCLKKDHDINVLKWITVNPCKFRKNSNINSFMDINQYSSIEKFSYSVADSSDFDKIYASVSSHLFKFIDLYSRNHIVRNPNPYFYVNLFAIFVYRAYGDLTSNVTFIFFPSPPHEGVDYIYYLVAKEKGIKTIIFDQSIFENHVFYTSSMEDYGWFKNSKPLSPNPEYDLEKRHEHELFYMSKNRKNKTKNNFYLQKLIGIVRLLTGKTKRTNPLRRDIIVRTITGVNTRFLVRRYESDLKSVIISKSRLDELIQEPYVYFPLHAQPEMSTSAIGGIYSDQMLALERLSTCLPSNWNILVKENPVQTYWQRDETFFRRVKGLRNVFFVPLETNTFYLTANSKLVSTITGTAGWEAIKGGKPTLVFGQSWYTSLPGVFRYEPGIDLEQIADYNIDHDNLKFEFNKLLTKTGRAIVHSSYEKNVSGFDYETNIRDFAKLVIAILSTYVSE